MAMISVNIYIQVYMYMYVDSVHPTYKWTGYV